MDLRADTISRVNAFEEADQTRVAGNRIDDIFWKPNRIKHQLCMNAVVGTQHVAWLGVIRTSDDPPWKKGALAELQRRADAYIQALFAARRLESQARARGRALFIFDANGALLFACDNGHGFKTEHPALLTDIYTRSRDVQYGRCLVVDGHYVRATRITNGAVGAVCVELAPVVGWQVSEVLTMSVQKRKVATLAGIGATVEEIAVALEISAWTVRTHLKQIYEQLVVANRAELGERLTDAFSDGPLPLPASTRGQA